MSRAEYINSQWIAQVREMIRAGYGVEDIALKLKCDVQDVRNEVSILRKMGSLKAMFGAPT